MELASLKAVLLKKAEGNKNLQTVIEYMGEKQLFNSVVESLQKMAKMGTGANGTTTGFGQTIDVSTTDQLRDAIGHHLAHYKAALKAHHASPEGSPEHAKFRKIADQHMEKALPLLHLAGKAAHHSKGELMLKYPSMMPWEANYTSMKRGNSRGGKGFQRDPKGLGAHEVLAPGAKEDGTGIPNYHYFEMPPNPGHPKVAGLSFAGGYPWEEIQLGHPNDIDAKKAYLHIPDVPIQDEFKEHPFDKHPISSYHKIRQSQLNKDMEDKYPQAVADFEGSPHYEKWLADQEEAEKNDPGFATRGHQKSEHVYEGMPLKPQRSHINDYPHVERGTPSDENWETEEDTAWKKGQGRGSAIGGIGAKAGIPEPPKVRKKSAAATAAPAEPKEHRLERLYQAWLQLPEHEQAGIMKAIPGMAEYVQSKKGGG